MKEISLIKKIIIFVTLIVIEVLFFVCARWFIDYRRIYISENEFLKTINCAEIFDDNPNATFEITFDIRAKQEGKVLVYQQNGSGSRYSFHEYIDVTEEYETMQVVVRPVLINTDEVNAFLAFFGEYGTGVIPEVRRIKIKVCE